MPDFAYLSAGRLLVQLEGEEPREIESPFAAAVVARATSIARRNAWKTQGRGARFAMGMEGLPGELLEPRLKATPVHFTGLGRGRHPAELVYTLSTGTVSGLFAFSGGDETRIFHDAEIHLSEPACEPDGERIACAMRGTDGHTHIALVAADGKGVRQLTEGDALDAAPCWAPGSSRLVFESRALGYDRAGNIADVAPAVLHELDLESGELTTIAGSDGVSCSSPRVAANGSLYYLRRPVATRGKVSIGRLVLDTLLFPFRVVMALVQYLNFFTLRYTGKPLLTAGDSKAKSADVKRAAVLGNLAQAAGNARDQEDDPELPDDWQLVAKAADGVETVVQKRVLCFDVYPNGGLIWSNGKAIMYRGSDGTETKLGSGKHIGEVAALPTP